MTRSLGWLNLKLSIRQIKNVLVAEKKWINLNVILETLLSMERWGLIKIYNKEEPLEFWLFERLPRSNEFFQKCEGRFAAS